MPNQYTSPRAPICTIPDCNHTHWARGFCGNHYRRWRKFGSPTASAKDFRPSESERFWSKVDKDGPIIVPALGPCWVWTASRHPLGYGHIKIDGQMVMAHRMAWQLAYGPIDGGARRRGLKGARGLLVLHHCDNPPCVRPGHLFLGTQADNIADAVSKGRAPHAPGVRNSHAKLTAAKVLEIRQLRAGGATCTALAKQFGVYPTQISRIINRKHWLHV